MNDAVIRATPPPRARPRSASSANLLRGLTRSSLSFVTAYGDFSEGLLQGLGDSLKSAWQLVSRDMWQAATYRELATTVMALNMLNFLNLPGSLAAAHRFDARWGTHVARRQIEILFAINKLMQDVPRWTPRQWGRAVGRLVGDLLLAKGAGGAVKVAGRVGATATQVARANVAGWGLGTMPARQAARTVAQKLPSILTDGEGFLIGPIASRAAPFNIPVSFYASEASFRYGSFRYSTVALESMFKSPYFGRRMLQITKEFQPKLGPHTRAVIPKGTEIKIGFIGPQPGNGIGLPWFQIFAKKGVPFK